MQGDCESISLNDFIESFKEKNTAKLLRPKHLREFIIEKSKLIADNIKE